MAEREKFGENQGEGNREAARRYNEAARRHIRKGDVQQEAQEAKRATEGREKDALKRAEEAGKSRAKDEDPYIRRERPRRG